MRSKEDIMDAVVAVCGVTKKQLRGVRGGNDIVYPKHIWRYMLKTYTNLTLTEVFKESKVSTHSSIINSIKQVTNLYATDREFKEKCDMIETLLKAKNHTVVVDSIKFDIDNEQLTQIFKIVNYEKANN
jgi:chromosomal replication initiation ATPase DnaA